MTIADLPPPSVGVKETETKKGGRRQIFRLPRIHVIEPVTVMEVNLKLPCLTWPMLIPTKHLDCR